MATTTSTTTDLPTSTPTPSSTSTPAPCNPGTNNICITGLSLGAKIGVIATLIVLFIAITAGIIWCYRRRRARRQRLEERLVESGYNAGVNAAAAAANQVPLHQFGNANMGGNGGVPEYSPSAGTGVAGGFGSPNGEFKSPVVGVSPVAYAQSPPSTTGQSGYFPPEVQQGGVTAPVEIPGTPVQHLGGSGGGGGYVPPRPQYHGGPEPVEAPQSWERGL